MSNLEGERRPDSNAFAGKHSPIKLLTVDQAGDAINFKIVVIKPHQINEECFCSIYK